MGFGKDGKGQILRENGAIALSTLGDATVIKSGSSLALTEDFRIVKSEIFVSRINAGAAGEGPLLFGIASDELTVTEIKEALEADGPLDPEDRLKEERATRPVWVLCQFGGNNGVDEVPNNGMAVEKTMRWTFSSQSGWVFFAYNRSGASLTGSSQVVYDAKHFGVWVR